MRLTRAMSRSYSFLTASNLPNEIWLEVLSYLSGHDLARALNTCKSLSLLGNDAWRAACFRRWPTWSAVAAGDEQPWRRLYELFCLRDSEISVDVAAVRKLQQHVTERHRGILCEWLCEVSFDWQLDSPVVFKAAAYLDHFLSTANIEALSRFQLVGLSCLRAAMGDARSPAAIVPCVNEEKMDPQRFAYVSDDTYSPAEVEEFTKVIAASVPSNLKEAPNARMFLRTFWYRALLKGVVDKDEMHIYTLAGFLLQLSLMDLSCSAFTASKLASSALSLALKVFNKPEWPVPLQQFGSYLPQDLEDCKTRLAELQATQAAASLRQVWRAQHESHGYPEFQEQWECLLRIMSSSAPLAPAVLHGKREDMDVQPATPALDRLDGVVSNTDFVDMAEAMQVD